MHSSSLTRRVAHFVQRRFGFRCVSIVRRSVAWLRVWLAAS
ncbi:hypothetical protein ACXZ9C_10705 [Streptococcus agalactiae]